MTMIRLQDAPPQYSVRDQVELRRVLAQQIDMLFRELRQATGVVVLGSLTITGGSAGSTFDTSDVISGGTA
jgi:hypothetical protein